MEYYENFDLNDIITPVDIGAIEKLLKQSKYNPEEASFLIDGFHNGFSIGYEGPDDRRDTARNIPFTVGNRYDMWNKLMKEVQLGCMAGPYQKIPYHEGGYIQSPIGLVPKSGGKTRLIFHLSYDFLDGERSLNAWTLEEKCSVKYNDLDHAIQNCLELIKRSGAKVIFFAKSDLVSTFRILPVLPKHHRYLLLKVEHQVTRQVFYFIDKCLPFGASISCSHFQRFSNALRHVVEFVTRVHYLISNYLDNYLFINDTLEKCNNMVQVFLKVCDQIKFPVLLDKTEWATPFLTFLGVLLDGINMRLSISDERQREILQMLQKFTNKKKSTVKDLQRLTGHLNFLS